MKFRKKPVVVEAFQYDGDFMNANGDIPEWAADAYKSGILFYDLTHSLFVKTLEGNHLANIGDFIIRGVKGELYPCKPDIFAKTYEPVEG